jgi:ABC-type dipeptide/oligopeptide/nickel transport system permease subunit
MSPNADQLQAEQLESVTGVHLAQGIGHRPAQSFWAEAWGQVFKRPAAVVSIVWIAIVSFFAVFAPLIASSHPVLMRSLDQDGEPAGWTSPLIESLEASDVAILFIGILAPLFLFLRIGPLTFGPKLRLVIAGSVQIGLVVILARLVEGYFTQRDATGFVADFGRSESFMPISVTILGIVTMIPFLAISIFVHRSAPRVVYVLLVALVASGVVAWKWTPDLPRFEYRQLESAGDAEAVYTIVPFSHAHSMPSMFNKPPGSTPMVALWERLEQWQRLQDGRSARYSEDELAVQPVGESTIEELRSIGRSIDPIVSYPIESFVSELDDDVRSGEITDLRALRDRILTNDAPYHVLGTDTLGQDVLSQMLHACRLAISIGFVSTGIAVIIGVTIGALMGYFGGWVDLLLYRVVEVFMAIPVLFLLIVAAGLLPRNTYVMMAIIGCFTWTGAARFIRAEFMKLRETDYVQAAEAMGLPLWSILFKHMLPNGVTPVLVESSFLIAAAILIEAILSFLGLGPSGQASWGSLLRNALGDAGGFLWWLAIFPGMAIFLTTLAYNMIGEALRDAIDPKLKKARV